MTLFEIYFVVVLVLLLLLSSHIAVIHIVVIDTETLQEHDDITDDSHYDHNSNSHTVITIGTSSIQYHPPFTIQQYPLHVVNVLQQYPLFPENLQQQQQSHNNFYSDENDNDNDVDDDDEVNQVLLASWYVDLGIAHRTVMEEYYITQLPDAEEEYRTIEQSMNEQDQSNIIQINKLYSITNFQEAISIYKNLIRKYINWIAEEESQIGVDHDDTSFSITIDFINNVIQVYEGSLADTMFALAETYTLLNDIRAAQPYYSQAYILYKPILYSSSSVGSNNYDDSNINHDISSTDTIFSSTKELIDSGTRKSKMEVHYAHCSYQLGLELIHSLNAVFDSNIEYKSTLEHNNVKEKDDHHYSTKKTGRTTTVKTLAEVMEMTTATSSLKLDNMFWKRLYETVNMNSSITNRKENDEHTNNADMNYTFESVRRHLLWYIFDNDIESTDVYLTEYIQTEIAISFLIDSADMFKKIIKHQQQKQNQFIDNDDEEIGHNNHDDEGSILEYQQTLANVLQNLASCIYNYQSDISMAIDYYEQALLLYTKDIIPSLQEEQQQYKGKVTVNEETKRAVHTATSILFALTEMYYHRGEYDISKNKLRNCLLLHEAYQLKPPSMDPIQLASTVDDTVVVDNDNKPISKQELLLQYEQALEEYYSLLKDSSLESAMSDDLMYTDETTEYYYEKDDSYEADIHVSIAMLYMEMDEASSTTRATTHFKEAIRLYEMSGDVKSSSMAIAKYNLFLLYLRDGYYRAAIVQYNDVIDVLRILDEEDKESYEGYYDPLLMEGINRHIGQHKKPYKVKQSFKMSLTKVKTTTTGKSDDNVENFKTRDAKSATQGMGERSVFIDLQHFLNQNHSKSQSQFEEL